MSLLSRLRIFFIAGSFTLIAGFGFLPAAEAAPNKTCAPMLNPTKSISRRMQVERSIKAAEMNALSVKHFIALVNERLPADRRAIADNTDIDELVVTMLDDYNDLYGSAVTSLLMKEDAVQALKLAEENLALQVRREGFDFNAPFSDALAQAMMDAASELYKDYRANTMMHARITHPTLH